MDIKKAEKADLEKHRTEGFLLGLVFALALLFTGLEYTTRPDRMNAAGDMLDDMAEDMELMPAMNTKDMVSASSAPASKALTDKVVEVEKPTENTDKTVPATGQPVIGEGDGMGKEAEVTAVLAQTVAENEDEAVRTVEQLPEFPGGMVEFMKWLTRNLRYPTVAQQQKIEGKVVVTFIVNKDGSIANPKVERSVNAMLDNEALRVIRMMPNWKPGMIGNKPCRTMFAIPVNFKI